MSHFLQRVAASVVQPKAKLQPMLGSIFAPTPFYAPALLPAEVSSQTIAPLRHDPPTAPSFNTSNLRLGSDALRTEDRLPPATLQEVFPHARLERTPAADPALLPTFGNPSDPRGPAHAPLAVNKPVVESSIPANTNQTSATNSYHPLIAADQSPIPTPRPRAALPIPAAVRAASEPARRFQPAQPEPDEIHIHIGRIEVAAIAEPAPRPAAAARRSLNLDEYLRHSNGRRG